MEVPYRIGIMSAGKQILWCFRTNWIWSFFVTIASVLGTGILGLPVKTANSGFWAFCVVFVVVLFMEVSHH
jgi:amino acid permease